MADENNFLGLGRRFGNLNEIPDELLSQLQISKPDELEQQITNVVDDLYGGMASVDEILIGIYRKFQSIQKRQYLLGKLYRMLKSGLIFSVKSKKGVYCTQKKFENYYISQKEKAII